jgi:hypothetical protein
MSGMPLGQRDGVAQPAGCLGISAGGEFTQSSRGAAVVLTIDADSESRPVLPIEPEKVTLATGRR